LTDCEDFQPTAADDNDSDYEEEMKVKSENKKEEEQITLKYPWDSDDAFTFTPKRKKTPKQQRDYKCETCGVAFIQEITLENHTAKHHPETMSKDEIAAIRKRAIQNRMRICPHCGINTDQLKQHIRNVHLQIKRFFCDHCEYATFKKFNIRSHVLRHSELEKRFTCHICGKKFCRKSAFNTHIKDFHEGKIYKCHCGIEFNSNSKLFKHKKWKHEDSKVPCTYCGKVIMKDGLAEHMRVDPEDRFQNYDCHDCNPPMQFPNKRCLTHHRLIHQERNFICDFPDCQRAYQSLSHLHSHQKWHSNAKSHECPYAECGKTYSKQQGLKIHVATKHQNYRKKCPVPECTYETGLYQDMRGHVKRHKGLGDKLDEYVMAVRKLNLY
jgi:KRAB domain-containing zinc finger protein